MLNLAYKNLFQSKTRLIISMGGVALALMLILALDAILAGSEKQITAYMDYSGADLFISQPGVRNMHMNSSALPASVVTQVEDMASVEAVVPILYLTNVFSIGGQSNFAYIIGVDPKAPFGGPWRVVEGTADLQPGQAIVDRGVVLRSGRRLGDQMTVLGHDFTIAGLSQGTATLFNSIVFIRRDDFARLIGAGDTISFLLVRARPGVSLTDLRDRIATELDATVQTAAEFAESERRIVRDMSVEIMVIMNLIGFLIGLAVTALMVYTATLSRRPEYGMLKAVGAQNRHLYRTVVGQALLSVALGLVTAVTLTEVLALVAPRLNDTLALVITPTALTKTLVASVVIAALAALLPARQVASLDPAMVFRKQ